MRRRHGPVNKRGAFGREGRLKSSQTLRAPSNVDKQRRITSQTAISILALLVSFGSASFSYLQSRNSAAQLKLTEQQLRPHLTYAPVFFREKNGLNVDVYTLNQSPLPARVIYADIAGWIDGEFVGPTFHSVGEDIVYQEKGGVSSLPTLSGKPLSRVDKGGTLILATCVIYSSNNDADLRRWKLEALHQYISGSRFPSRPYMKEYLVDSSITECSARTLGQSQGTEQHSGEDK